MSTLELSSKERSQLRAAAHPLKPVVQIGDNGLSESVLKEIDNSLTAHGLIKVKVAGDERQNRLDILQSICDNLSCASVAHVGKILTLFRPSTHHPELLQAAKAPLQASERRPGEDYTPKKLAAAGKTIKDQKRRAAAPKGNAELVKKPVRKPSSPGSTGAARKGPNIPRRAGSALSLRAGRRSRG